jgi:hypothetical protein
MRADDGGSKNSSITRREGTREVYSCCPQAGPNSSSGDGGSVPQRHVRGTQGSRIVLIISIYLHGRDRGRRCTVCDAKWTVSRDKKKGVVHAWRDDVSMDEAILDYTGNNAVVECCRPVRTARTEPGLRSKRRIERK